MRRPGRKGRVLKWAGLFLSLLIGVAWAISWCGRWSCFTDRGGLLLVDHRLWFTLQSPEQFRRHWTPREWAEFACNIARLAPESLAPHVAWRPFITNGVLVMPLWICLVITAVPTGFLWWRDRRRIPPGHCQRCGYNLTGNVSGVCPECGEVV